MTFVANLRSETIEMFEAARDQPGAYLLSSHRVTPAALEAAAGLRARGIALFADNGTKPRIDDIMDRFAHEAAVLSAEMRGLRRELGRTPRGSDIPDDLRERASDLAQRVVDAATAEAGAVDSQELLETQLTMSPTDLIVEEDFATACLIGLDLERELTGWRIGRFDTRNRRSLSHHPRVADALGRRAVRPIAVLSAMDFNTARSAGRIAAERGVADIAIGMAGIMRDPSAVDSCFIGSRIVHFDRPAPRRYVRLAEICAGMARGFRDRAKEMHSFHALGLGSAAHFPIPGLFLDNATRITTDATSPIHDAVRDLVFYDPQKDGRRRDVEQIVSTIISGEDWPFVGPFTRRFRERHGHDPPAARRAWETAGQPPIERVLLRHPLPLVDHLPLFGLEDSERAREASRVRIAHNHWVLGQLAETVFRPGPDRPGAARAAIDRLLASGSTVTVRGMEAVIAVHQAALESATS